MAEFLINTKAVWFAFLCPFGAFFFWRETWKMLKAQGCEDSKGEFVSAERKPLDFRVSMYGMTIISIVFTVASVWAIKEAILQLLI